MRDKSHWSHNLHLGRGSNIEFVHNVCVLWMAVGRRRHATLQCWLELLPPDPRAGPLSGPHWLFPRTRQMDSISQITDCDCCEQRWRNSQPDRGSDRSDRARTSAIFDDWWTACHCPDPASLGLHCRRYYPGHPDVRSTQPPCNDTLRKTIRSDDRGSLCSAAPRDGQTVDRLPWRNQGDRRRITPRRVTIAFVSINGRRFSVAVIRSGWWT